MDGHGFTAETWASAKVFKHRCATPHDVDQGAAVFALADTFNGRAFEEPLPQPVIWYDDDEEFAALIVQAEVHETGEGEVLEILGLLLPDGRTAVAFTEDVDEVADTDPVWRALLDVETTEVGMNGPDLDPTWDDEAFYEGDEFYD